MGAAVNLEDAVVEILDAEAQARDAHVADRGQLRLGQRARFALERDFFGTVPRRAAVDAFDQARQLRGREERRRAAAEIDEVDGPIRDHGHRRIELPFASEAIEVGLDLACVAVGVDAEITKMAPLPAEGNVQIDAERHVGDRW